MRGYLILPSIALAACASATLPSGGDAAASGDASVEPLVDLGVTLDLSAAVDLNVVHDLGKAADLAPIKNGDWWLYEPGLESATFDGVPASTIGDSKINVVRVDPTYFTLRLAAAGELGTSAKTAPDWASSQGLVAVINASLYQNDDLTSEFYMRDNTYVNNGTWSSSASAVFATGRRTGYTSPEAQVIDQSCQDLTALDPKYDTLVQSYRMIDCAGASTWAQSTSKYSIAAVGTDNTGRVLLIHSRSPYSVHDLTAVLKALPLDLKRLMYASGGQEASLYLEPGTTAVVSTMGSYETGVTENDDNHQFWPIPNVLGVVRK
jgi:hypothetical protein